MPNAETSANTGMFAGAISVRDTDAETEESIEGNLYKAIESIQRGHRLAAIRSLKEAMLDLIEQEQVWMGVWGDC